MLQVKDLYVAYGQSEALHGISFESNANETVAIMGRNGMGKTTLFKSLMGVLPTKSGQVTVAGQDVTRDESYRRVAKGIAYVPQGRMIFPTLTVEENIETGLENAPVKKIPEEIYALFPVLWDMRRRKGGNLSGGQQQRVAIARMLMQRPRFILADEPDASLDPQSGEDVMRLLLDLVRQEGLTLVVISHRLEHTLGYSDRILGLSQGRISLDTATRQADAASLRHFFDHEGSTP